MSKRFGERECVGHGAVVSYIYGPDIGNANSVGGKGLRESVEVFGCALAVEGESGRVLEEEVWDLKWGLNRQF